MSRYIPQALPNETRRRSIRDHSLINVAGGKNSFFTRPFDVGRCTRVRATPFLRVLASLCETSGERSRRTRFVLAPRARSFERRRDLLRCCRWNVDRLVLIERKIVGENPRLEKF